MGPATGAPFDMGIAGAAQLHRAAAGDAPGMFGGPPQGATGLAGLSQTGIPQMIGDLGPNLILHRGGDPTAAVPAPYAAAPAQPAESLARSAHRCAV